MSLTTFKRFRNKEEEGVVVTGNAEVLSNCKINAATLIICTYIMCIINILNSKESGKKIRSWYIGKTYIRKKDGKKFKPEYYNTWDLSGVLGRFAYCKKKKGMDNLVVVAVVTEKTIPIHCKRDGYITQAEEYAYILKKRLIEWFMPFDKTLANETTMPGKTDENKSEGYVIYIAYKLK